MRTTATILLALILGQAALGRPLAVTVVDRENQGVAGVAVIVAPVDPAMGAPPPPAEPAVMNQADREFRPHVLVVQTGARVSFPNNDDINHHVYSFSSPKSFELQLYKGSPHPPLTFDRPGLVVLGCNIHDNMLGYILVVDTPYFALTDEAGVASFSGLPAGEYTVRAWTPRVRPDRLPAERRIRLGDGASRKLSVQLTTRLLPAHGDRATSLIWSDY